MYRKVIDLVRNAWRRFQVLFGEEYWEFQLLVDKDTFLQSLEGRVHCVRKWLSLSPGWCRSRSRYYGHVNDDIVIVRIYQSIFGRRMGGPHTKFYAFVGKFSDTPDGVRLKGDYRLIPVARHFFILSFAFILIFIAISVGVFIYGFVIERTIELALRGLIILCAGALVYAVLRFLILAPQRIEQPFRENLKEFLFLTANGQPTDRS